MYWLNKSEPRGHSLCLGIYTPVLLLIVLITLLVCFGSLSFHYVYNEGALLGTPSRITTQNVFALVLPVLGAQWKYSMYTFGSDLLSQNKIFEIHLCCCYINGLILFKLQNSVLFCINKSQYITLYESTIHTMYESLCESIRNPYIVYSCLNEYAIFLLMNIWGASTSQLLETKLFWIFLCKSLNASST